MIYSVWCGSVQLPLLLCAVMCKAAVVVSAMHTCTAAVSVFSFVCAVALRTTMATSVSTVSEQQSVLVLWTRPTHPPAVYNHDVICVTSGINGRPMGGVWFMRPCVVPLLPHMVSVAWFIHCKLQIACFVRMKTLVSMVAFAPTWGTASTPVTVPWGTTVPTVNQVSAWRTEACMRPGW